MNFETFQNTYCNMCGTQRCEGIFSIWINGCSHKDEIDKRHLHIFQRLEDHYWEAINGYFNSRNVIGIFLQGSQNYGLDTQSSDIDTKLIIAPTFKEITFNKKPVSTTHVRANNEHTDFKDIRLYIETFRKQNLNFLEILFTPYKILNSVYEEQWNRLVKAREAIAHMNPYRSVQSMRGIALEKYHAMEHPYPSKIDIINEHGYDPKQLHHLLRVEDYLERYIHGESYEKCLRPTNPEALIWEKTHFRPLAEAQDMANAAKAHVEKMATEFFATHENKEDPEVNQLLNDVQYEIMKIAIEKELIYE